MEGKKLSMLMRTRIPKKRFLDSSASNEQKTVNKTQRRSCTVKLEHETEDEFLAILDKRKCEEKKIAGQFETVYLKSKNKIIGRSKKNSRRSKNDPSILSRCRLCANQNDPMVYIFGWGRGYRNVAEKIKHCLPIMVKMTDTLPKHVCHTCIEKLDRFYEFHKAVAEAQVRLLMYEKEKLYNTTFSDEQNGTRNHMNNNDNDINKKQLKICSLVDETAHERSTILDQEKTRDPKIYEDDKFKGLPVDYTRKLVNVNNEITDSGEELQFKLESVDLQVDSTDINDEEAKTECEDKKTLSLENIFVKKHPVDDESFVNEEVNFTCGICDKSFDTETEHKEHCSEHREGMKLSRKDNGQNEDKFVTGLKIKLNEICYKTNDNPYRCEKCDHDMNPESSLREHLLIVHKDNGESNSRMSENKTTVQEQIGTDKKIVYRAVACAKCKVKYRSDLLQMHSKICGRIAAKKSTFTCEYCGKVYGKKSQIAAHMKNHMKQNPHSCMYCVKTFEYKKQKDRHEKNHKRETSLPLFRCSMCGRSFNLLRKLLQHSNFHSKTDYYPCSVCDKSFDTIGKRTVHMAVHAGGDLYRCDKCGAYFKHMCSLGKHRRDLHGMNPLE